MEDDEARDGVLWHVSGKLPVIPLWVKNLVRKNDLDFEFRILSCLC